MSKEAMKLALKRAFQYGADHWYQADHNSYRENKKADKTLAEFRQFVEKTCAALAEQPAQQEPVAKMGMYEHKCPNVTGHRGPSFVCQKAGHGVGQNSYCKGCICPEALNTSQPAHVQQGWPSDCLVSEKAKQSGFDLSPMPNLLYTVRGNHAQLVNFARAMLATAPQPAQQEPVALPCCGYTDASAVKWNPYNQVLQCHNCGQVYTSPLAQRTWVGLTEFDIDQIPYSCSHADSRLIAYAIEAKLREKNGITKEQT